MTLSLKIHRIHLPKINTCFLATMGESLNSDQYRLENHFKMSSDIINTRVKQEVFSKIQGKHSHILENGT